nr:hypothetical protein [Tanacetum cinerariifolium]
SYLLEAVSERLEFDANCGFMVTYNSDNYIIEVCDDLEFNEFMKFVVKSTRIVTLWIVESSENGRQLSTTGSNQQSKFIHDIPSVDIYQIEYHATQMPEFPGSGFYQNFPSYQQMHGFPGYPMYVSGFPGKVIGSVFEKVKRLSGKDESSESDEESSEYDEEGSEYDEDAETTPVENNKTKKDKF